MSCSQWAGPASLVPIFGLLKPSFKTGTPGQIRTDTLLLLREPTLPIGLQGHIVSRYKSKALSTLENPVYLPCWLRVTDSHCRCSWLMRPEWWLGPTRDIYKIETSKNGNKQIAIHKIAIVTGWNSLSSISSRSSIHLRSYPIYYLICFGATYRDRTCLSGTSRQRNDHIC